jgi:hypothetical protein
MCSVVNSQDSDYIDEFDHLRLRQSKFSQFEIDAFLWDREVVGHSTTTFRALKATEVEGFVEKRVLNEP